MKSLIEQIAKGLVDDEAAVVVVEVRTARAVAFEITAADADYGKLIGAQGSHIKALRTLLGAVGRKSGVVAAVEVNDPRHRRTGPGEGVRK